MGQGLQEPVTCGLRIVLRTFRGRRLQLLTSVKKVLSRLRCVKHRISSSSCVKLYYLTAVLEAATTDRNSPESCAV